MLIEDKIKDNIEINTNGCWLWLKYKDKDGYGQIKFNGKTRRVHRISYEVSFGPIPKGLTLDHLCRVRSCCNPFHLEPVTQAENVRRGNTGKVNNSQTVKTHCPQGHEYTEENTYRGRNSRKCRVCSIRDNRARYYLNKNLKIHSEVG